MALQFGQAGTALVFKMEVLGETQVLGALTGIIQRVRDLTPVWPALEEIVRKSAAQRFESEGSEQNPWPALADRTVRIRLALGYPGEHPILVMTGRLKDSIIEPGHPEHIFVTSRLYMETGTRVEYAIYHQSPEEPREFLPRRPFYSINAKDVSRMVQAVREYLDPSLPGHAKYTGMGR